MAGLRVAVLGGGTMGNGIAQVFAQNGHSVVLRDLSPEILDRARATIDRSLAKLVEKGKLGAEERAGTLARIRTATDLSAVADVDLFELNEAFAVQAVAVTRELALDPGRVNVHGGAVALGHPIGASGARVLTTLIHALRQRGGKRGVAALCLGGGNGVALAVEIT